MYLPPPIAYGPLAKAFTKEVTQEVPVLNPEELLGSSLMNAINFKSDDYKHRVLSYKNIILTTQFSIYGQKVSGPTMEKIMEKILVFPSPSFYQVKTVNGEKKLVINAFLLEGEYSQNINDRYYPVFPVKDSSADNLFSILQLSADIVLAEQLLTENQT